MFHSDGNFCLFLVVFIKWNIESLLLITKITAENYSYCRNSNCHSAWFIQSWSKIYKLYKKYRITLQRHSYRSIGFELLG